MVHFTRLVIGPVVQSQPNRPNRNKSKFTCVLVQNHKAVTIWHRVARSLIRILLWFCCNNIFMRNVYNTRRCTYLSLWYQPEVVTTVSVRRCCCSPAATARGRYKFAPGTSNDDRVREREGEGGGGPPSGEIKSQ